MLRETGAEPVRERLRLLGQWLRSSTFMTGPFWPVDRQALVPASRAAFFCFRLGRSISVTVIDCPMRSLSMATTSGFRDRPRRTSFTPRAWP